MKPCIVPQEDGVISTSRSFVILIHAKVTAWRTWKSAVTTAATSPGIRSNSERWGGSLEREAAWASGPSSSPQLNLEVAKLQSSFSGSHSLLEAGNASVGGAARPGTPTSWRTSIRGSLSVATQALGSGGPDSGRLAGQRFIHWHPAAQTSARPGLTDTSWRVATDYLPLEARRSDGPRLRGYDSQKRGSL